MRWLCKLAHGLAVMTLAGAALLIGAAGSARVRRRIRASSAACPASSGRLLRHRDQCHDRPFSKPALLQELREVLTQPAGPNSR
jgi:hypothetical protein